MEKDIFKVRRFVIELFNNRNTPYLKYHNRQHTEKVVERSIEIAKQLTLSDTELFCLIIAAWFHDVGHLFNELKEHEQAGADLMRAFLQSSTVDDQIIQEISACILASRMNASPVTTIQQILCDADTYHFGTKEFFETDPKIYEEIELRLGIPIENKLEKSIRLLESHQFYTPYCRDLLERGKRENISVLKNKLNEQ